MNDEQIKNELDKLVRKLSGLQDVLEAEKDAMETDEAWDESDADGDRRRKLGDIISSLKACIDELSYAAADYAE